MVSRVPVDCIWFVRNCNLSQWILEGLHSSFEVQPLLIFFTLTVSHPNCAHKLFVLLFISFTSRPSLSAISLHALSRFSCFAKTLSNMSHSHGNSSIQVSAMTFSSVYFLFLFAFAKLWSCSSSQDDPPDKFVLTMFYHVSSLWLFKLFKCLSSVITHLNAIQIHFERGL